MKLINLKMFNWADKWMDGQQHDAIIYYTPTIDTADFKSLFYYQIRLDRFLY